jgi:DNA-binding transcriptional ArsR family regulator
MVRAELTPPPAAKLISPAVARRGPGIGHRRRAVISSPAADLALMLIISRVAGRQAVHPGLAGRHDLGADLRAAGPSTGDIYAATDWLACSHCRLTAADAGGGGGGLAGRPGAAAALRGLPGLPLEPFIVYRRLTMNDAQPLDRRAAETYAAWFRALADGTRVQVVSLLARSGRPLTVKQIAAAVPVGQSTVSEHLRQLAAVGFVLAEERGTSRLYRINGNCVECFPTAADLVMGKPSPVPPTAPC